MPRKVRLSGAEERKRRNAKRIGELLQELVKLGWQPTAPSVPDAGDDADAWAREFEEAGQPDLDDPGAALTYVRRLQLVALRQQVTTPRPSPEQIAVWKRIEAQTKALGMTQNRVELEERVGRVEGMLETTAQSAGPVKQRSSSALHRPPTSRGGSRARRPRLVDEPPPDGKPTG